MKQTIDVEKIDNVIDLITEIVGGIDEDQELIIEIEVVQIGTDK